jgi:hypothetical protein
MTVIEQEELFVSLKNSHPAWTDKFCSGYVAGVVDEATQSKPKAELARRRTELDHYALGYLTGFAMHRGQDAETEPWFGFVGNLVKGLKDAES